MSRLEMSAAVALAGQALADRAAADPARRQARPE
jgi:hypothetical protein